MDAVLGSLERGQWSCWLHGRGTTCRTPKGTRTVTTFSSAPVWHKPRMKIVKRGVCSATSWDGCFLVAAVELAGRDGYALLAMMSVLISLWLTLRGLVRSRIALHLEVLALRHQL